MSRTSRLRTALNVSALNLVLPKGDSGPGRILLRRLLVALALLLVAALVVFAQGGGYHDANGSPLGFVDALYYATVSLSTTGYGDIVPVTTSARVVNIAVITPLRLGFLVVLVGTTVEVLTAAVSRRARARRWRNSVKDHVVVIGYGTKGRAAAEAIISAGTPLDRVAVIDLRPAEVERASEDGLTAICGDASRAEVLHQVAAERAARVVIATNRDDTSVLVTLTIRRLNTTATVVAGVRLSENADLLRSAGADAVVVSAEAAGRLLGISADSPATADVVTDLLGSGEGLELVERPAEATDSGRLLPAAADTLLAIVRDGKLITDAGAEGAGGVRVQPGDRLVVVRHAPAG